MYSVNQVDQISLYEKSRTTHPDDVTESTLLCIKEACFTTDATGLLKPTQSSYAPVRPMIESINMEFSEIPNATYSYVGEDTLNGIRVFKYEMSVAKEVVDAYNAGKPQIWYMQTIIEPYPQITFFVNAEDGFSWSGCRKPIISIQTKNSWERPPITSHIAEIVKDFTGWNTTTFTVPDMWCSNTEWQPYTVHMHRSFF